MNDEEFETAIGPRLTLLEGGHTPSMTPPIKHLFTKASFSPPTHLSITIIDFVLTT
jgi:hypothetical protein